MVRANGASAGDTASQITGANMDWMTWYDALEKPAWTPASATIGLIWQIRYPMVFVTFGFNLVQLSITWMNRCVRPTRRGLLAPA